VAGGGGCREGVDGRKLIGREKVVRVVVVREIVWLAENTRLLLLVSAADWNEDDLCRAW
jgi:hypothetical protein